MPAKQSPKLAKLNSLRAKMSMVPINVEPENVDERITRLEQRIAEKIGGDTAPVMPTKAKGEPVAPKGKKAKKSENANSTPSEKPKPVKGQVFERKLRPPEDADGVRLGDICKKLRIDAREARVKLRRAYRGGVSGLPKTIGDAWLWKKGDVPAIEKLVKS